jgi:hypothetical protein
VPLTIAHIEKPDDCEYLTVAECLRRNAERHRQNALRYLADGKPDYAAGSLAKAKRNLQRADYFS